MGKRTTPPSTAGQPKYIGIHGVSVVAPMSWDKYDSRNPGRKFQSIKQSWTSDWAKNRNKGSRDPTKNKTYANMTQREYELMRLGQWGAQNIQERQKAGVPVPQQTTKESYGRYQSDAEMSASGVVSRMISKTLAGQDMQSAGIASHEETRLGMNVWQAVSGQAAGKKAKEQKQKTNTDVEAVVSKPSEASEFMTIGGAIVPKSAVGQDSGGTAINTSTKTVVPKGTRIITPSLRTDSKEMKENIAQFDKFVKTTHGTHSPTLDAVKTNTIPLYSVGGATVPTTLVNVGKQGMTAETFVAGMKVETGTAQQYSAPTQIEASGDWWHDTIRYSDLVDSGTVDHPRDTPGLGDDVKYYLSTAIRPGYNVPLDVMNIAGVETPTQPTTLSSLVGDVVEGQGKGMATTDTTPQTFSMAGGVYAREGAMAQTSKYVMDDPLRAISEAPMEVAMVVLGGRAISATTTIASKYSPLTYQASKMALGDKTHTVWQGLTWKDKPLIGFQEGHLIKGFNPSQVAAKLEKVQTDTMGRSGYELSLGTGVEKELYYSKQSLQEFVKRDLITPTDVKRVEAWKEGLETTKGIKAETGAFGTKPIEGLTQEQSDYLLTWVAKHQKKGDVQAVHGSTALRPQISEGLRQEAGVHLQLGDVDVVIKAQGTEAKTIAKANKLIQDVEKNFPLDDYQKLVIKMPKNPKSHRSLTLVSSDTAPESGMVLYHGTDFTSAKNILERGFTFSKSLTSDHTIFTSTKIRMPEVFATMKNTDTGTVLKITLRKDAKILDMKKPGIYEDVSKWWKKESPEFAFDIDEGIRKYAKVKGYHAIKGIEQMSGVGEIEIVSSRAIKSIEPDITTRTFSGMSKSDIQQAGIDAAVLPTWKNPLYTLPDTATKPKKIFEIVNPNTETYGAAFGLAPYKIMAERLPKGTITATDTPVKAHVMRYQTLTNVKQAVAFQPGIDAKMMVYPSSGRTKDIVRAYWSLRQEAVKVGGERGAIITQKAENIRSLYPKISFDDFVPEKGIISFADESSTISSKLLKQSTTSITTSVISSSSLKTASAVSSLTSSSSLKTASAVSSFTPTSIGLSGVSSSAVSPIKSTSIKMPSSKTPSIKAPSISIKTPSIKAPSISIKTPTVKPPSIKTPPGKPPVKPVGGFPVLATERQAIVPPVWKTAAEKAVEKPSPFKPLDPFRGNVELSNIIGVFGRERTITRGKPGIRRIERTERFISKQRKDRLTALTVKEVKFPKKKKDTGVSYLGFGWSSKAIKGDATTNFNLSKTKKSKKKKGKGQKKKSVWQKAKKLFN